MKSFLAALIASAATLAPASTTTPDFSDLWYNRNESGWGVNVIQQSETMFVTMFVYGQGGSPTWFVASDVSLTGMSGPSTTFSGTLYQTSGPAFSAATFDPHAVTVRPVGTLTFTGFGSRSATLQYTVDGASVTKSIERQTWKVENLAGDYLGASTGTWTNCPGTRSGYQEFRGAYAVTQSSSSTPDSSSLQIREIASDFSCVYTGTYTAAGRAGSFTGNVTCTDGLNEAFVASEVDVSMLALSMRMTLSQPGACVYAGRLGGMRRAP